VAGAAAWAKRDAEFAGLAGARCLGVDIGRAYENRVRHKWFDPLYGDTVDAITVIRKTPTVTI
jgi:hypothetical protein